VWERVEVNTGFWWGNLRERNHLEDLGLAGDDINPYPANVENMVSS
jgi:hypothetical protein